MRKFCLVQLALSLLLLITTPVHARQKAGQELAFLLQTMVEEREVHPDSLYPQLVRMKERVVQTTDPTERAIEQAVLGYLYGQSARTAQARSYETESDSTNMKEWSQADYYVAAGRCFAEALSDMDLLHQARQKDWLPLLTKGNADSYYDHDMLSVVWRAAWQTMEGAVVASWPAMPRTADQRAVVPSCSEVIDYYRQHGYREAAFLLVLDSLRSRPVPAEVKQEFGDLRIYPEVYIHDYDHDYSLTNRQRDSLLREALALYPRFPRRTVLENMLENMHEPDLLFSRGGDRVFYPGEDCEVALLLRNVREAKVSIYRMRDGLSIGDLELDEGKNLQKRVRENGRLVNSFVHRFATHPLYESAPDTLRWMAGEMGRYVMMVEPLTDARLAKKPTPMGFVYSVSRLCAVQVSLPKERRRIIVCDAQTGAPVERALVRICKAEDDPYLANPPVAIAWTDGRGMAEFDEQIFGETDLYLTVQKDDDKYYPWAECGNGRFHVNRVEEEEHVNLYADRKLYRPGQTVHVGGVISCSDGSGCRVVPDRTMTFLLIDANYREVGKQTVTTDEYGVFSMDFELPKNCLPGNFGVRQENNWRHLCRFRVEEYKRPTFDVTLDEVPALQLPADSLVLTGKARFFSGAPLRGARVAVQYNQNRDTLYTDEEGNFRLRVSLDHQTPTQWKQGVWLMVEYSVLSAAGEKQTASQSIHLCSLPLRIAAELPHMNDKSHLLPWTFTLYSSTGKEVDGQVMLELRTKQGQSVRTATVKNGKQVVDAFATVPSGAYDLYVKGVAGKDTARVVQPLVMFSQEDQRLPLDTVFWVNNVRTEFAPGMPARIQVGSSRKDVSLHYLLMSNKEVIRDTIFQFSDSLFVLDIPYEERCKEGLNVRVLMVKDGQFYSRGAEICLKSPDKELRHRWITFRDKLQPGQQETWQLQLTNPDGTAARANLMTALYDASLDAISQHRWGGLDVYVPQYRGPSSRCMRLSGRLWNSWYSEFVIKQKKEKQWVFSSLNMDLFGGRIAKISGMRFGTQNAVLKEVKVRAKEFSGLNVTTVDEALQGRIAGLDIVESTSEGSRLVAYPQFAGEAGEEGTPVTTLRENFNETAFFYPSLRTDEAGVVTISFTLPESMTRWRMLNLAHTEDLNTALWDETVVAQKELMAQLVLPRFLRQGDEACLTASVTNISDQAQKGRAQMFIMDAETDKVVGKKSFDFSLAAKSDTVLTLPYTADIKSSALIIRIVVDGDQCQDGEQRLLPILPCTEHVLNTMDISLTQPGTYTYDLSTLLPKEAADVHYSFDYTSRPVWMAIRALPSLARPCCDDVLSLSSAYYARTLGSYVAQHMVGLDAMIAEWQKADDKLARSPLEQNQEVKNLLLNETPWVLEARNETQRQQHLADLFCEDVQLDGRLLYMNKVEALQRTNGSFSWFPGLPGSYYMTCRVAYQLARLQTLTNGDDEAYRKANQVLMKALDYLKAQNQKSRSGYDMAYLYVLYTTKESTTRQERKVASAMLDRLEKDMENLNVENLAEAIIVLQKAGREKSARKFMDRLEHFLVTTDKEGTYIEHPQGSWTSIDRKIAIHTKIMEAEATVGSSDKLSGLRRYLLRQKRTEGWDNPGNTADAVYALLLGDTLLLAEQAEDKVVLNGSRLTINKRTKGESWGAAFVQCQAPLKDVEAASTGLKIRQEIVSEPRKIGDRLVVRYVVTADRDYEYVVLRGSRPACLEPVTQLSGYRWQNGLGYYRAMHDASTDYCFDRLPRGTYVLEEEFNVSQLGNYQTGLSTLQCQYAPEFQGRTSSRSVMVK